MVDNVKRLLSYLGISYIHMEVGEGEAIAAEPHQIIPNDGQTQHFGRISIFRKWIENDRSGHRE